MGGGGEVENLTLPPRARLWKKITSSSYYRNYIINLTCRHVLVLLHIDKDVTLQTYGIMFYV